MKAPSPACFAAWEEHRVATHDEWLKRTKDRDMAVIVQLFGASWGYLVTKRTDVSHEVIEGKFDWNWTAMDACEKAEAAWAKAMGGTP